MRNMKQSLLEKGWNKRDADKTARIIEEAKANKHPKIRILDKSVFWISLLIAIIGNFIISISLIPILLALNNLLLYLILITIGISFGLLFELLIRTIDHLQAKHHLLLGIIMPLIAVINILLIASFSNDLEKVINIRNTHNPMLIGVIYAIALIIPYAVYQLFFKN